MKILKGTLSRTIGINLWLAPQISEHWPKKIPDRSLEKQNWLIRPGTASIFKPKEGIVQEWITSADETKNRDGRKEGITNRLSTSNKRILESSDWIMYESKFNILKSFKK